MGNKDDKKVITGNGRTHTRMHIDIPLAVHRRYKTWCAMHDVTMTAHILWMIEETITDLPGALPTEAPAKRRKK